MFLLNCQTIQNFGYPLFEKWTTCGLAFTLEEGIEEVTILINYS